MFCSKGQPLPKITKMAAISFQREFIVTLLLTPKVNEIIYLLFYFLWLPLFSH